MKYWRKWICGLLLFSILNSFPKANADTDYSFEWLDPDKKIYVVQNRRYRKESKPLFSLLGGLGLSSPYRNSFSLEPRLAYYFSERFGVEAFYSKVSNSSNKTFKALETASPSALPIVREIRSQMGLNLQWVPWYAKLNLFDTILYLDWYLSLGVGRLSTELDTNTVLGNSSQFVAENLTSVFIGTGHHYYLSDHWIARVDLLGAMYSAPIFGNSGESVWYSNFHLNVGMGFRF